MKNKTSYVRSGIHNGLLFAVPLGLSVQCDSPSPPPSDSQVRVYIDPTGKFVKELNDCLVDQEACLALCHQILAEDGSASNPEDLWVEECTATKIDSSTAQVDMVYGYPVSSGCGVVTVEPESKGTTVGSHYAALAQLEAESVFAFVQLARDLRRHAAPLPLVAAALRAAHDEVHHTRQTSLLAQAWGSTPHQPKHTSVQNRDLYSLCLANTVDGCVHETFGAAVAAHQARNALDPFIRSVMTVIARDEARHAALARAIDHWARPRIFVQQRSTLELATRLASQKLADSQRDAPKAIQRLAGFPSVTQSRTIIAGLEAKRRARWA